VFPHCGQATESSGMISGTPEMGVGPTHRDDAIGGCETAIGISPHPRRCVVSRIRTHGVAQASIRSERRSTVDCAGAGATPSRFETLARCLSEAAAVRTTDRQSDPKCLASLCRSSLRPSPFPRGDRILVGPQAASSCSSLGLSGSELAGLVVGHVSPRESVADHFHVDEAIAEKDAADLTLITVDIDDLDADGLVEHFAGEILSSLGAERLALLWRVDAGGIPMKRDMDLVRQILTQVEQKPAGS
jgi:hypothetical protein